MKKIIVIVFCIYFFLGTTFTADAATVRPKIKVGLYQTTHPITITVNGKSQVGSNVIVANPEMVTSLLESAVHSGSYVRLFSVFVSNQTCR